MGEKYFDGNLLDVGFGITGGDFDDEGRDEMNRKLIFSNVNNCWCTPQDFFDKLNAEFSFTLDPCATEKSTKCKKYFTAIDDGLKQDWGGHKVFVNPPYGRQIGKWVKKCYEEGQKPNTTVVMLIPSRT